jgi:hypothetical protein
MANTSNVAAGKPKVGGAVSVAPTGTALPTDATTSLNSAFVNLGYISEDGMTQGITRDSETIKAWGGDTVMTSQTDFGETFSFTLIEILNPDVKKVIFGDDNVTGTIATGLTAKVNSKELPAKSFVVEMIQNSNLVRIVIPNGKVTELGDISYTDGEVAGYEVTITALPDSNGNCSYEYSVASE